MSGSSNGNDNAVGAIPVQVFPNFGVPLGYAQIAAGGLASAVGLPNLPANAVYAIIIAEAQPVRYRDDGVNPTAAVGMLVPVNTPFLYAASLSTIKFIAQSAGAILNVSYYG